MKKAQRLLIDNKEYFILDQLEPYRIEDSFIHRENKLSSFSGNGEAKKHVGSYSGDSGKRISAFFNYSNWGIPHLDQTCNRKTLGSAELVGAIVSRNCFFSKSNLSQYIQSCQTEYNFPTQNYHRNIKDYYNSRSIQINTQTSTLLKFTIFDASDNFDQRQNRGYIKSDEETWELFRKISLPKITMLSVLKLMDIITSEVFFYFKLFIDPDRDNLRHPSVEGATSSTSTRRPYSQEEFKREVHLHLPKCPFSGVSDERLLVASHIKPNIICIREGRIDQASDRYNGLSLSPTYDRLFDRGLITFTDSGQLICGTELKLDTWLRLQIDPTITRLYDIKPKGREEYLDYHRNHVFPNLTEIDLL
jgi:putative restriction endonuclease